MGSTNEMHQKDEVRVGNIHICFSELTIKSRKSKSQVELRVMRVLETLIRHHGKVVTREDLHNEVWQDTHVSDDALNRAISILRQKLAACGAEDVITTIPRRGYRFDGEVCWDEPRPAVHKERKRGHRQGLIAGLVAAGVLLVPATGIATARFVSVGVPDQTGETDLQPNLAAVAQKEIDQKAIRATLAPLTQRGLPVEELVTALVETQDFEKALQVMRSRQDAVMGQLGTHEYTEYLHQTGALAYDRDDDAAISVYGEILRLRPDDGLAATRLARSYLRRGHNQSAASVVEDALGYSTVQDEDRMSLLIEQARSQPLEFNERVSLLRDVEAEAEKVGFDEGLASARRLRVAYEWMGASDAQTLAEEETVRWISELVTTVDIYQDLRMDAELASSQTMMGLMYKLRGDLETANELFESVLATERELHRPINVHAVLTNLAMTNFDQKNLEAAARYNDEAIQTVREANLPADLQWNWMLGAEIALADGRGEEGCRLFAIARQSWPEGRPFSPDYQDLQSRLPCREQLASID